MRGFDAFAGVIKSGGKTRRAAKMVILNADHPDVREFIRCKADEEKKAWALIDAGYDGGFNVPGGAYDSVHYQNANHSVRVTDVFMKSVVDRRQLADARGDDRQGRRDAAGARADARDGVGRARLRRPGHAVRHHDQPLEPVQEQSGRINASNPCSEYMFLDDTACNLAPQPDALRRRGRPLRRSTTSSRPCDAMILAQEIIVDSRRLPDAADRAEQPSATARSGSATRTSARC